MTRKHTITRTTARTVLSLSALALLLTSAFLFAGPLDPPAGPVTSTYKTLAEVEPRTAINAANTPGDADSVFKITQRGSYYLTGNIAGVTGKHGIEIAASGVTLDLGGFDLLGVAGSLDGVSVTLIGMSNIVVLNGSVRSWGDDGVDLGTTFTTNGRVEGIQTRGNGGEGISTGHGCTVSNCSAIGNAGHGILTGTTCTISNCSVRFCAGDGIHTEFGCTVSGCTAVDNTSSDPALGHGIVVGDGCSVSNCSAYASSESGIRTGANCSVTGCAASANQGDGILVISGCTVTGCSTSANARGGIYALSDFCTITNCSAAQNIGGITVSSGCTVAHCTADHNSGFGIKCWYESKIQDNSCSENGALGTFGLDSGIWVGGSHNRLEGNNCVSNGRGIFCQGGGNIIVRNTCSASTISNWDVPAGNAILVIQAAAFGNVHGDAGGVSLGSTDPNANFTY